MPIWGLSTESYESCLAAPGGGKVIEPSDGDGAGVRVFQGVTTRTDPSRTERLSAVKRLVFKEGRRSPGFARRVSSRKMASRSHLPTAATAARRLLRHRGAGHRPALGSCRPHRAGFAGTRRRTLLRPRRCDVWRRGAGRQASSPTWSLAGSLGSATRRPSSHELQTATSRHAQSVRVAGSLLCSHAGRRKTVLAVMPYPSRFERETSIDASTRTVPPLSTTASVVRRSGFDFRPSRGC